MPVGSCGGDVFTVRAGGDRARVLRALVGERDLGAGDHATGRIRDGPDNRARNRLSGDGPRQESEEQDDADHDAADPPDKECSRATAHDDLLRGPLRSGQVSRG